MWSVLKHKQQKGFTLLEAVLYLALFGVMASALISLGFLVLQHGQSAQANFEAQTQADFVDNKLRYLLENSTVVSPTGGNRAVQLLLQSKSTGENITLSLSSSQLVMQRGQSSFTALTAVSYPVTTVSFQLSTDKQLTVNLTINAQTYSFHYAVWTPN